MKCLGKIWTVFGDKSCSINLHELTTSSFIKSMVKPLLIKKSCFKLHLHVYDKSKYIFFICNLTAESSISNRYVLQLQCH